MDRKWLEQGEGRWVVAHHEKLGNKAKELYTTAPLGLVVIKVLKGACTIRSANRWFDLGGSHLLLVDRCIASQVDFASGDLSLTVTIFNIQEKAPFSESVEQMGKRYPDFLNYCKEKPAALLFNDTFALVTPMIATLEAFLAYPPSLRETLSHIYISYILMVIVSPQGERGEIVNNPYVSHALNYIEKHYMARLCVGEIAQAVGIHTGYLHKLFYKETGKTINEYITHKRINYVKFLLVHTDFSMEKIAELTGIGSIHYLSKLFKKRQGVTPQTYRANRSITCVYEKFADQLQTEDR